MQFVKRAKIETRRASEELEPKLAIRLAFSNLPAA
jgi:hypothetical protein